MRVTFSREQIKTAKENKTALVGFEVRFSDGDGFMYENGYIDEKRAKMIITKIIKQFENASTLKKNEKN